MHSFEIVVALVVVATVVAALAERLRAPAPSMLVLAGLAVGLIPGVPAINVSPELVAFGVLPPLLYAAATDVALVELVPVLRTVGVLAVGLVVFTAGAVAIVIHAVYGGVSIRVGLVLGAVLASTDPIAVSALARRLHLPPRLLALVQGESLLNDATSLVLFKVTVALATAGSVSAWHTVWQFVELGGGGALVGLVAAMLTRLVRRRLTEPVLETVLALVVPYGVYVAAEALHTSGVTAVVLAGLMMSERRRTLTLSSGTSRVHVATVYGVVQFLLESTVFAVIGLELPNLVRHLPPGDRDYLAGAAAVVGVVILVRALWIYPAVYLPGMLRRSTRSPRPHGRWQAATVICWVGTRGVVPLAAALSIPEVAHGAAFPHRDLLLVLTISAIMVTLVVQGLTLEPVVKRLGIVESPHLRAREEALGRVMASRAALSRLADLVDLESVPEAVARPLQGELERRLTLAEQALAALGGTDRDPVADQLDHSYRAVRRELLAVEANELFRLQEDGTIGEAARRAIQRSLDVQESELRDE